MGGTCCFHDTTAQNRIPLREYYYSSNRNSSKIYNPSTVQPLTNILFILYNINIHFPFYIDNITQHNHDDIH